jgi:hypothetical protein
VRITYFKLAANRSVSCPARPFQGSLHKTKKMARMNRAEKMYMKKGGIG